MKSSFFVTFSSVVLLAWLAASYLTALKPEPRLGRGSLPLSAKVPVDAQKTTEAIVLAEQDEQP